MHSTRLRATLHPSLLNVSVVSCADVSVLACLDDNVEKFLKGSELDEAQNTIPSVFNLCISEDLSGGRCPKSCGLLFNASLVST